MRLRFNQLVDFFHSVENDSACPICKTSAWSIFHDDRGPITVGLPVADMSWANNATISVYAYGASCDQCGFIRLHDQQVVHKQFEARQKEQADG